MNILLNLNEGTFPIEINKEIKELKDLNHLGELKGNIKLNLSIEKLSKVLFFAKGDILATYLSKCQRCSKKTSINLNIKLNIGIKDTKHENRDGKGALEIHYQHIDNFDINDLVVEEILLNFPQNIYCCELEAKEITVKENEEKIKPFKKIRDLIK